MPTPCQDAELTSLITGAGTIILGESYCSSLSRSRLIIFPTGLSWLIGDSLSAVLTSIIFLFIKHPFDVGDVIDLGEEGTFTVKEIRLLSTIMLNGHGTLVQASNVILDTLVSQAHAGVSIRVSLTELLLPDPAEQFIQNIRRSPQVCSLSSLTLARVRGNDCAP